MQIWISQEDQILLSIARNVSISGYSLEKKLPETVDWESFFMKSVHHKMFLLSYIYVHDYLPDPHKQKYKEKYDFLVNCRQMQIHELEKITQLAKEKNVSFLLIKGIVLSQLLYGDLFSRDSGDLDLLVYNENSESMCGILKCLGYIHSATNDEIIPSGTNYDMGIFHEYWFVKKKGSGQEIWVEVKTATSAIPERLITPFIKYISTIKVSNNVLETHDLLHTFLHLCANTYGNSEKRLGVEGSVCLRDYIDLYLFISKYRDQLNWLLLKSKTNDYEMLHQMYCVLNNLNEIYPDFIAGDILEHFNPHNATYEYFGTPAGTIVPWESYFLYRMFNVNERINEYRNIWLKYWYSNVNENYKTPYIVKEYCENDIITINNYIEFQGYRDKSVNFMYSFTCDKDNVYISLNMDQETYHKMDEYVIAFFFMYDSLLNNAPQEYNFKWIFFEKERGKVITRTTSYKELDEDVTKEEAITFDSVEYVPERIILLRKVSNEFVFQDLNNHENILCYNAFIFRKVDKYLFPASIKFSHPDFPEETEHMGVLKFPQFN